MNILLNVLFIFVLRVLGVTFSTLYTLLMMRGMKLFAATLGFCAVLVQVVAIGKVVQNLNNIPNLLSYCLGFSIGTLLGMWLEERMAIGYATVRVISPGKSHRIADAIRQAGYGATEDRALGKDGVVNLVTIVLRRREIDEVYQMIRHVSPEAFITVEETRRVERGYLRASRHER